MVTKIKYYEMLSKWDGKCKIGKYLLSNCDITDKEIEKMLVDSMEHAEEDVAARMLHEQQVEANRVIEALASALEDDGDMLSVEERQTIDTAAENLVAVITGKDNRAIKNAMQELDKVAEVFVSRRMDSNIRKAMAGHNVDEFEG